MNKLVLVVAALASAAIQAFAGHHADSTIWSNQVKLGIDSGWVVNNPTGSSDYFNQAFAVTPGIGNNQNGTISDGLPLTGVAVSISDFGSGRTYAVVGVYGSNLGLDPSGLTPDLASVITSVPSPSLTPPPLFEYEPFDLPEAAVPAGSTKVHVVTQLPPGDAGLLGVGADSTAGNGNSGFTTDGYSTPAILPSFIDFGLSVGQDNSSTTSCKQADRKPHGRLRAGRRNDLGSGDHLTTSVRAGDILNLAFFGVRAGDRLRLYFNVGPCTPAIAIGPVLPTIADGDGDGSFVRLNATWPAGFGGQTFQFSAVWGNSACSNAGVGFTNCVTVITAPDWAFGVGDDGTVESGWSVQNPSGSSDYFNNDFGDGSSQNGVVGLAISVLDFGTSAAGYPTSGVSNANLSVDPSGSTPDIAGAGVLATVSPFTFPALTFATTSSQYVSHVLAIPGAALGLNVHGWVQFPPGDPGLLGVGADTSSLPSFRSGFASNGYASPAVGFFGNFGIRLATN